jgi:hypothetical protein
MANVKISQLTELTSLADADTTIFVDASESSVESTKKVTFSTLQDAILNHATTLDFEIAGTAQLDLTDGVLAPTTDADINLGSASKQFNNLYLESGITINAIAQGKDVTVAIHRKKIDIGDWNMDLNSGVYVAHGLDITKIVSVSAMIRSDTDGVRYPINFCNISTGAAIGHIYVSSTYVYLNRVDYQAFDAPSFDATSYNRGFIIIGYVD